MSRNPQIPQRSGNAPTPARNEPAVSNFIRQAIEADLAAGKYADRRWAGRPGPASLQVTGAPDPARIRTRFPPEPNGYLHIGHAKSVCLNFGLALEYGGACHLRFDDTNPEKEDQEYVDSIIEAVKWLGFDWGPHLYYASDYFDFMYAAAEHLVTAGHAYVDEQSAEEIRAGRGSLTQAGANSPWRDRPAAESLSRLREMRDGRHADGSMVLRAKIDMASPNINLRDPAEHQPARPGDLSHPHRNPPPHRRQVVHLSDVHLRAPHRGCARERDALAVHARVRGPAAVLRLAPGTAG
jgi:glutaminyl-tRNA synthetase